MIVVFDRKFEDLVKFGGSYGGLEVGVMEFLEREVKLKEFGVEE